MALVPASSHGGGPAAGTYLPTATATGVTVDTTTYADAIKGGGAKLTTLIFPADQGALAFAISGDAFPRLVMGADPTDYGTLCMGDGTLEPTGAHGSTVGFAGNGHRLSLFAEGGVAASAAVSALGLPNINQVSPLFTIASGALPTLALVSGAGAQVSTSRDAETVTPFTGDGTNNAATCAIALSPDNVTYSVLDTLSIAAAINLSGALALNACIRVPAGWYLKLTAVHGTIGTTTYY